MGWNNEAVNKKDEVVKTQPITFTKLSSVNDKRGLKI